MFVQLILFTSLFPFCFMMKNNSHGICYKENLCRKKIGSCHPVVVRCQNSSCRYRAFDSNDHQRLSVSRWFYDFNYQRCRRYNNDNQAEDFVFFRFLRHCKRLCSINRQKKSDKIITVHISEKNSNPDDTVYVRLHIDFSPHWIRTLTDWMNISTAIYNSQVHYFQNYRRRFTNFVDPSYQLMLDQERNTDKKNY